MAMGDGVLTLAAQKLTDFLIQEATFLLGIKDELVSIRDELFLMKAFLKDAEQKQHADERVGWWTREIRAIAYKTEDVIDAYYEEVKGKEPSKRKLLTTSLRKFFCIAGETNLYDIGKEIKALKERLSDISRKREVYGINYIGNTQETCYVTSQDRLRNLRRTTSLADEEHFVGVDDDFNLVKTQILLSEKRRSVISIWGMGGLGKTSLARKLYNTNKCRFKLHAWVCVSQEWNTRDLLQRIINSLKEPTYEELKMLKEMNDDRLKRHLHEVLKDKRYLMVIDDMWEEEAWDFLRSALPDNQNGSRVIITTRIESVAELSDPNTYVHKLRRLRDNESWELFCKKAFSNQNGACSQDLEKIAKELVAKCDGLPLAIIVLGGLLTRKQPNEWHAIKKHVWKALIDKSNHISALLDLSYNDLSRELKSCFLYLAIFPEDHEIRSDQLIQLWIAEELIPQSGKKGVDLEELAESYIKELNARSLIEVTWKKYKMYYSTCRVHDLLRDLAVNKAKEQNFLHIYEESANQTIEPFLTRRIAFRSGFERYVAAIGNSHPRVHTLSFLNYHSLLDNEDVTKLLTLICTRFKSLRVLDLEGVKIETRESKLKLFEAMGKLVHLRYLGLRDTDIDELPELMGNLQALQALNFNYISNILLPRDMCKLKHLRHLSGSFSTRKGDIPSLKDLTNLHSLARVDINGWLGNEESNEFALKAFSKLRNLRILSVVFTTSNYTLSIAPLFSCKNLIELKLYGRIKSLPMEMHKSLPNLTHITLHGPEFVEDPLPALEKLPNLLVLDLNGIVVKLLIITATGFYKLLALSIHNFAKLEIEEGALPSLRYISSNLKKITLPERLRDLPLFD